VNVIPGGVTKICSHENLIAFLIKATKTSETTKLSCPGSKKHRTEASIRVPRREGVRCGESRGSHRPFIGVGECRRGVAEGSNGSVNGVNDIERGGEVKRGIKEGEMMAGW
jgi:hypothetical protein